MTYSRLRMMLSLIFFVTTSFKLKGIQPETGMALYKQNCIRCHGADGTKGFLGAKDLSKSILPDVDIVQKIRNGKGFMPSFKKKLAPEEIEAIVDFVKSLRTN